MTLPPSLLQRLIDTIFIGYFYSNLDCRLGHSKSKKRRFTVLSLKNKKSNIYFSCLKGSLKGSFLKKAVNPKYSSWRRKEREWKQKERISMDLCSFFIRHESFAAQLHSVVGNRKDFSSVVFGNWERTADK